MRRRLEVEFVTPSCALVRGYGSRELIKSITSRSPVWATLSRGWSVQPAKARDVIAAAEDAGYDVVVHGGGDQVVDHDHLHGGDDHGGDHHRGDDLAGDRELW